MHPFLISAFAVAILAFSAPAEALDIPADLQAQMQKLQELPPEEREALARNLAHSAQVMQQCIEDAGGEDALDELRELHNAHQKQVAELCNNGHREQAQAYASDAAQELTRDQRVSKLHECSRVATQNMPQLSKLLENGGLDTSKHVCD